MAEKYPRYRMTQWLDTSEEAMNRDQATILYGIQTQREAGLPWYNLAIDGEAALFDSPEKASATIAELRGKK